MKFIIKYQNEEVVGDILVEIPEGWYRVFNGPVKNTDRLLKLEHRDEYGFVPYNSNLSCNKCVTDQQFRNKSIEEKLKELSLHPEYTTEDEREQIKRDLRELQDELDFAWNHLCVIRKGLPPYELCHECKQEPALLGEKYCEDCRKPPLHWEDVVAM